MGNVSSVLTSPIESVVSCGGAFDNVEGTGLFSDVYQYQITYQYQYYL